jgi:hypothetical protein
VTDQPNTPATLAAMLRATESAESKDVPWAAWQVEPTASNDWAGKAMIAGLPIKSVDRSPAFLAGDAQHIAAWHPAAAAAVAQEALAARREIAFLKAVIKAACRHPSAEAIINRAFVSVAKETL